MKSMTASNHTQSQKLGRNDPCHCGSGFKYKKCCSDKDRARESAVRAVNPANVRLEMEQVMGKLGKLVESKNMSIEDLNAYFAGRSLDDIDAEYEELGELSDKQKAQDMIYGAYEASSPKKRKKIIDEAMALYPHLPDAWIILAEDEASTPTEALSYFERAVAAGEKDLGEVFFKENEGHFWGLTETRPYMRAKAYLADTLWGLGREDEAIAHYQDCLRLNPNDNQGIRDVLITYLLIKSDLDGAEKILSRYKDDFGASHAFSKALFLFKKHGPESKKAIHQIEKAIAANGYVPEYLLGKLKLPKQLPDSYSPESKEEAVIYVDEAIRAWKEAPGAIRWLAQFYS